MRFAVRRLCVAALLGVVGAAAMAAAQSTPSGQIVIDRDTVAADGAELRALDTLNGRTQDITLRRGETAQFGNLEITLDACRTPQSAAVVDAYAFLRIRDRRDTEPRFSGWMFASSPALSALDHPRYDVWVLRCSNL